MDTEARRIRVVAMVPRVLHRRFAAAARLEGKSVQRALEEAVRECVGIVDWIDRSTLDYEVAPRTATKTMTRATVFLPVALHKRFVDRLNGLQVTIRQAIMQLMYRKVGYPDPVPLDSKRYILSQCECRNWPTPRYSSRSRYGYQWRVECLCGKQGPTAKTRDAAVRKWTEMKKEIA